MKEDIQKIMKALGEFCLVSLLTLIVPLCLFLDVKQSGTIKEASFTEGLSAVFVLSCCILFSIVAVKVKEWRSFSVLLSGFFLFGFIREIDAVFDTIKHGAWIYPATCVLIAVLIYSYFHRESLVKQIVSFINTKPYYFLFIGFSILFVFSRVFGCGALWRVLLDQHYQKVLKTMVEEGLEFLGYFFMLYGSLTFFRQKIKRP